MEKYLAMNRHELAEARSNAWDDQDEVKDRLKMISKAFRMKDKN